MKNGNAEKIFGKHFANFSSVTQSAYVFIPKNYTPFGKWGLMVSICPDNRAWLHPQWKRVMSKEKLLFIAPHGAGNNIDIFMRFMLALDSIATMKKFYSFSDKDIIVQGLSGGGGIAAIAAFSRPDIFRAAIVEAKACPLPISQSRTNQGRILRMPHSFLRNFSDKDWEDIRRKDTVWAFISGDKDFNYRAVIGQEASWKAKELKYKIFDVPGMAHANASGKVIQKVIQYIRGRKITGFNPRKLHAK